MFLCHPLRKEVDYVSPQKEGRCQIHPQDEQDGAEDRSLRCGQGKEGEELRAQDVALCFETGAKVAVPHRLARRGLGVSLKLPFFYGRMD